MFRKKSPSDEFSFESSESYPWPYQLFTWFEFDFSGRGNPFRRGFRTNSTRILEQNPSIPSLCSNFLGNCYWTSSWSTNLENSWPIWEFHRLTIMSRQLTVWLLEERIDLWMKFTTAMSNSDPAQNYYLHFRNHKGENLALKNPIIATRKLVLTVSQVNMATRKLVQTISAVLPMVLSSKRLPFLRTKGSGQLCPPILRTEELCQYRSPKWLQGWYVFTIMKTRTWWIMTLGHRKAGIAEGVWETWSTKFLRKQ